nr:UvrD-helicase domain-containing protein [Pseudolysinimonas kribbensis]
MTLLSPDQARLARRSFSGPARVRGAAGTGKTAVALHRAAYLARTTPGRVLVTSYVRTLPRVMAGLMQRLAPDVADRIEFASVHAIARRLLTERRGPVPVDAPAADDVFRDLWVKLGGATPLAAIDPAPQYWLEELHHVIKGRGLTAFDAYETLPRAGRRRPLNRDQRAAMWRLYVAYEQELRRRGILDWDDLVLEAEASLQAEPLDRYDAVIVDEAQDLSCAMLRMLHLLVGDRPDGLLLVADGRQSIYPGGYTLAEAGISVAGRGRCSRRTTARPPRSRSSRRRSCRARPRWTSRGRPTRSRRRRCGTDPSRCARVSSRGRCTTSPSWSTCAASGRPAGGSGTSACSHCRTWSRRRRRPRSRRRASRPSSWSATTGCRSTPSRSERSSAPRASSSPTCSSCAHRCTSCARSRATRIPPSSSAATCSAASSTSP